jgi:hypothetical protein
MFLILLILAGCATDNAPSSFDTHANGRTGFYTSIGGGPNF